MSDEMDTDGTAGAPVYAAPAVEKALDVLELLAEAPGPMSQNQIAAATGRSVAQIFRVLNVLERRGYIARETGSGHYVLALRLFELAHRSDPIRTLVTLADAPLRALAASVGQSCNLGVRDGDEILVVAEADGRTDFGFRVRVGARFPLVGPPSGELLIALAGTDDPPSADEELRARLATFRRLGYAEKRDHLHLGVVDLAFPITRSDGQPVAALTIPYVATSWSEHPLEAVRDRGAETARTISVLLGGAASPPPGSPPAGATDESPSQTAAE
jgi:DNA-binding IclR family transcriptional regulator